MAIGPGYKTFTFDGQNSGSYDVYITGEAVYNAPERAVEMITIPGRDGDFVLDKGRYENIPVKYPAGMYGDDQSAFAAKVRAFRNMMASRVGYCRLEDGYNPDEYRLAVYKSGLEVEPVPFQRAGEFDILFDCKPQRFLKSGETAQTVINGGTLTNPTLHEAMPLLEVTGYGVITFNGFEIEIANEPVGDVSIAGFSNKYMPYVIDLSSIKFENGDTIDINGLTARVSYQYPSAVNSTSVQNYSGEAASSPTATPNGSRVIVEFTFNDPITFTAGTGATKNITAQVLTNYGGSGHNTKTIKISVQYIASTKSIKLSSSGAEFDYAMAACEDVVVHSSAIAYGQPTYIDCDLGEAYYIEGGEAFSLNKYIDLGSELPTLAPGANTFTKDNTITQLKVTPRWWEL